MSQRGLVHRVRVQAEIGGVRNVLSSDLYLLSVTLDSVTWTWSSRGFTASRTDG